MKKKFYLPFVAALALTSCSNNEPGDSGSENNTGDGYLAISIAQTPEGGSRAAGDQYQGGGATFEDGLEAENKVTSVRFYFFSNGGSPVSIVRESADIINYFDWTAPEGTDENHSTTVEKILNAVVIIETSKSGAIPAQVVAVVNPYKALTDLGTLNRQNLYKQINNNAQSVNNGNPFTMTNSVYMSKGSQEQVFTATIAAQNIQKTKELAQKNPVTIYVERNVAKVRIKSSLALEEKTDDAGVKHQLLKLQAGSKADIIVDDEDGKPHQVYLDLKGWNVTATLNNAYIMKHIDTTWPSTLLSGLNWNAPDYFRSYWAMNCQQVNGELNQHGNFGDAKKFPLGGYTYCNENAAKVEGTTTTIVPTKVIIAGILCDEKAQPLTICEFASTRMIGEENLKALYLGMIQTETQKYYYNTGKTNSEGKSIYAQIGTNKSEDGTVTNDYGDIKIITFAEAVNKELVSGAITPGAENNGCYYSYCCLTDEAKNKAWYTFDDKGNPQVVDPKDIEKKLIAVGHAKIWNKGMTYYYQSIEHVPSISDNGLAESAKESALYGVVRNHIYEYNLKSIFGLGTPVYNPDEVIYPEHPIDEDSYIAAQVKILSWRVVSKDLTLNWGD